MAAKQWFPLHVVGVPVFSGDNVLPAPMRPLVGNSASVQIHTGDQTTRVNTSSGMIEDIREGQVSQKALSSRKMRFS